MSDKNWENDYCRPVYEHNQQEYYYQKGYSDGFKEGFAQAYESFNDMMMKVQQPQIIIQKTADRPEPFELTTRKCP